uniref:Glycoside hydrolase 131 catalytic N-terminal domain-containing protein n=1 Tax=Globisporangium ultimum (strain ATCC 200006 / CBS 805.95 / DAOM BR144) TaxID=431595 RepID=K3WAF8_GLOUD
MKLASVVLSCAALACSVLSVNAQDKPLPWDGRGQDLTDSMTADPANYVTIDQKGRSPAYNDDTGVINIAVDKDATQNNFRRSELVQMVEGNTAGKTFFRASVKKDEAFLNKYQWQIIFPESHIFEIRIDAAMNPPKIIYLNNGTWDAKWETEFQTDTWYNFGIAVSKPASGSGSHLEFYTSEGEAELKLAATHTTVTEFPSNYEFHYGMLTLSDDGSDPFTEM